jgi:HAAS
VNDDLIERYLAELRASLRTPPAKTAHILAEAEDHLRESVAAGRAAGLTERAAQQAAISAFGAVRAVVRAHPWRPATGADLVLAACRAVGVYLLTVCAVSIAVHAVVWQAVSSSPPGRYPFATPRGYAGSPTLWLGCGIVGLALLGGCHVARRIRQRRAPGQGEVPSAFYSLVTAVFCVLLAVVLALASRATRVPHGLLPWAVPGALVATAGYGVRVVGLTLASGRPRDAG